MQSLLTPRIGSLPCSGTNAVGRSKLLHVALIGLVGLSALNLGFHSACYSQRADSIRVSAEFDNQNLEAVLADLEQKSSVPFYFRTAWVEGKNFTGKYELQLLTSILGEVLTETGLAFALYNNSSVIIAPADMLSREFSQEYYRMKDRQSEFRNENNFKSTTQTITLGTKGSSPGPDGFRLHGTVSDKLEGQRLSGATILIKDLGMVLSTSANGEFDVTLTEGVHLAEIRIVGYEAANYSLNLQGPASWDITLLPEATELDEVMVRSTAENNNVVSEFAGVTKLTPIDLREMPVFLGEPDVIKSILTLPGVSTVGEGASGFNVRGGNIDQNLIMQDDALVFNSSHAMGFFSIFNPDAVKEVTLYKGHIPAQYGGRVSSVLDVQLKGNNYDNFKVSGGLGMLASRLTVETPLVKGKTSLLAGGRAAYSDWVLNLVSNRDVQNSSMAFYDFNVKVSQRIGDNGSLAISAYNSHDNFRYSDQFGFSWDMSNYSLRWSQAISPVLFSDMTLSGSLSANASYQPSGIDGFTLNNGMNNYKFKEDLNYSGLEGHAINGGLEINAYVPEDETLAPYNEESAVIPYDGQKDRGVETAAYINDVFDITDKLSISLGLRFAYYTQIGPATVYEYTDGDRSDFNNMIDSTVYDSGEKVISYNGLEPRLSLRYIIDANSSIKLSYNRINQFIHLISNTAAALPIDYWQMSNNWFKPLIADNYSIGYFRNFRLNQWETSAEIYYRDLQNLVDYKDFPDLFLNRHLETELMSGAGRSYGLELFLKKKAGKLNGWVSYTYSRALVMIDDDETGERVNNGEWYPSKFDQPHNLSLVGNLHLNKTNNLSFNFTYSTGRPLTGPDSNYSLEGYLVPGYSERNEFRLPDYHRLDVSYTIERGKLRTNRFKDSFTISIYNLYARKNAYSVYFRRDQGNTFGGYKLAIIGAMIPSVTYNFQF